MNVVHRVSRMARVNNAILVFLGGAGLALGLFLVLPLIQVIAAPARSELVLSSLDAAALPPPPPQSAPEPEPPPKDDTQEKPPPELAEDVPLLDLAQLELALEPAVGEGWLMGDLTVKLGQAAGPGATAEEVDALFSLADLDQKPRAVYQPSPLPNAETRKAGGGTVLILFSVSTDGRVQEPAVQGSPHPALERSALAAVKQWRFEPGTKGGKPVRFRMRVPITFPKS